MPSDVTGVNVLRDPARGFEFQAGPIFTDLLLGDEINRAPAKTQSALLEAMAERQVTVDGVSRPLGARVHGVRDAESGGARGHLSAARGAARSLPAQDGDAVSDARGGARAAGALRARLRRRAARCAADARGAERRRGDVASRSSSTACASPPEVRAYIADITRTTREERMLVARRIAARDRRAVPRGARGGGARRAATS